MLLSPIYFFQKIPPIQSLINTLFFLPHSNLERNIPSSLSRDSCMLLYLRGLARIIAQAPLSCISIANAAVSKVQHPQTQQLLNFCVWTSPYRSSFSYQFFQVTPYYPYKSTTTYPRWRTNRKMSSCPRQLMDSRWGRRRLWMSIPRWVRFETPFILSLLLSDPAMIFSFFSA